MKTASSMVACYAYRTASLAAFLILLAGCGGRVSHPVEATNSFDDRLSCDQLHAERRVNDARIADLRDEKQNSENNNVGLIIFGPPLMIDVSHSEAKEIDAFQERNKVLDSLIAQRCQTASGGSSQP